MNVHRIAIVEVEDAGAGQLLRLHLEQLGYEVALNRPGKPTDFFAGFAFFGQPADAAIICAHGDDGGIVFPEMAAGVDELVLPGNRITPDIVEDRLIGAPPLVISTACATGTDIFAAAFRKAGTNAYVAPEGDPEGRSVPLWIATFFQRFGSGDADMSAIITVANGLMDRDSRFRLFNS